MRAIIPHLDYKLLLNTNHIIKLEFYKNILKETFLAFKNGVKSIQTVGYNGVCTVNTYCMSANNVVQWFSFSRIKTWNWENNLRKYVYLEIARCKKMQFCMKTSDFFWPHCVRKFCVHFEVTFMHLSMWLSVYVVWLVHK